MIAFPLAACHPVPFPVGPVPRGAFWPVRCDLMPPDAILFISDLLNWRPLCIGRPRPVYSDRNEVDILLRTALRLPLASGPDCLPLARQGVPRTTLAATTP